MAHYVISDLHGHMDEFLDMLKLIGFTDADTIYILGDVIDRGKHPITLLQYILKQENMTLLMGNHEKMFLDSSSSNARVRNVNKRMWLTQGGYTTIAEIGKLSLDEYQKIMQSLSALKYYAFLEVEEKKYFLSHAGVCIRDEETLEDAIVADVQTENILWNREELRFWDNTSNYIMIHGHTPTVSWKPECAGKILEYDEGRKINIDCGCAKNISMGCLRLEDGEKFYVDCEKS